MKHTTGSLEVICGSMFSGKTEELIRRVRRAQIAHQRVQIFKPRLDNRYGIESVRSHNGLELRAIAVGTAAELLSQVEPGVTVVAVDEVQFFDSAIVAVCAELAQRAIRVIAVGLDMDFRGEPFGPVPTLMAEAEKVDKLQAICVICGDNASRSQRLINGRPAGYEDPVILIGAQEVYEARCRKCHQVPPGRSLEAGSTWVSDSRVEERSYVP